MPDQQLRQELLEKFRESIKGDLWSFHRSNAKWPRSKKRTGSNTVIYDLERDELGHGSYLIRTEIEGKTRHYKSVELASSDPQSDIPSGIRHMDVVGVFWKTLHTTSSWAGTATDLSVDIEERELNAITDNEVIDRLIVANGREERRLICDAETLHLNQQQRDRLAPILLKYILEHRDSIDQEELVTVGSAIRKYIAMLDVVRLGELAALLEAGHRAPLPLDLELEVAKMIYRKFEANPPAFDNPQPELARRLWEIAQAYLNPRVLLRDKHATVASLAIEALVAMRSQHAESAFRAAVDCPYAWFGEMVRDNIDRLRDRWQLRNPDATAWCDNLINEIVG